MRREVLLGAVLLSLGVCVTALYANTSFGGSGNDSPVPDGQYSGTVSAVEYDENGIAGVTVTTDGGAIIHIDDSDGKRDLAEFGEKFEQAYLYNKIVKLQVKGQGDLVRLTSSNPASGSAVGSF